MILPLHNSKINQETFFFTSILYSICIINAMVTTKYYLNCIPWRGRRDFPHTSILIDINIHTMENGISIHMLVHNIQSYKLLNLSYTRICIKYTHRHINNNLKVSSSRWNNYKINILIMLSRSIWSQDIHIALN